MLPTVNDRLTFITTATANACNRTLCIEDDRTSLVDLTFGENRPEDEVRCTLGCKNAARIAWLENRSVVALDNII